jgi:hypothetical protein
MKLTDLLYLGNDDKINVMQSSETDPIQILHERFGHVAHSTIHEACRNKLFEGVDLPRQCYNKKFKCPSACHICNRVKVTRRSFRDERKSYATAAGDYISCDMGVFINSPSREGYVYTLVYTDHASKYTWLYGLKTKDQALDCLKHLINVKLPKAGIRMKHYHSDGAGELIGSPTTDYLDSLGITYSCSPRDTPELNGVSERKNRTHNEMTLCMLTRSGLDRRFWYDAYRVAQMLCNRLPTKTAKGYMTPYEFINGNPPNMEYFRIWGCKCYVRDPRGDMRKDWSDKSRVGVLMGYSEAPLGWIVYVPELGKMITSVHVRFNEEIPDYRIEYFKELEEEMLVEEKRERSAEDFLYLVGTQHFDPDDFEKYEVTRIAVTNDSDRHIIAYRCPVFLGVVKRSQEEAVHVRDVEQLYLATLGNHRPREEGIPGDGLDFAESGADAGRDVSTSSTHQESKCSNERGESRVVRRSVKKRRKEDLPVVHTSVTGIEVTGSSGNDVETSSRRVSTRTKHANHITNVKSLGDIGDSAKVYYDVCAMMAEIGESVNDEPDPTSTREALEGPHRREWQESMEAENEALNEREVFEVVRRPSGARMLRCRYIHHVKRLLDGIKYKSRLVVLGCSQRFGIDYNETFAPVAKADTIRILFALSCAFNLHIHQMDVDTAFLYAPLKEDIYMIPPTGMEGILEIIVLS